MSEERPNIFMNIREQYPEVSAAYDALGAATASAGPLDIRTQHLVKLALAIGAGLEGATHSHTRRALEMGITPEELRHVALLAITTLGFPTAMKGMSWINDIIGD